MNAKERTPIVARSGSAYLALTVACILQSAAALAADAPKPGIEEEVIVTGTRASLESAIERKKTAATVVDSIVAEDVASFPDKNVGEALQRVTGVQLTRDFGEGTAVSIRGVEPDLNRVEVNGLSLLGNNGLGDRRADFRELASELIKAIDVYKGSTADMTEGGIGGTVSIVTRKPLELEKTLFSVTTAAEYLDTVDKYSPRINATFADNYLDQRLGFMLNVTYDKVETRGDYVRDTEWQRFRDFDSGTRPTDKTVANPLYAAFPTFASCATVTPAAARTACETQFYDYSPSIPRYSVWLRTDKRTSGMGTVQFRFTDDFDAYLDVQYNDRKGHYVDNNYVVDLSVATRFASGVTDANHNVIDMTTAPTRLTTTTGSGSIFNTEQRDFEYHLRSQYYSSGFTFTPGNWNITGLVAHSTAITDDDTNRITLRATIPGIRIQLDPGTGTPRFTFPAGFDPQSISTYNEGPVLQYRPSEVDAGEDQAKVDFDWALGKSYAKTIEFGAQYRDAESLRYAGGGYTRPDGIVVPSANVTVTVNDPGQPAFNPTQLATFTNAVASQTPGTFFDNGDIDHAGIPNAWLTPSFQQLAGFLDLSGFNHSRVRTSNGYAQVPAHDVIEKITALYVKDNFEWPIGDMNLTGNIGVRWVQTKDDVSGSYTRSEIPPAGGAAVNRGVQQLTLSNSYNDVLPSFNLALSISPTLVTRFGVAKVLARPKPTDLVPNATCTFDLTPAGSTDSTLDTCTAGNPDLKPYRADQYDLGVEWYPNRDTQLSAAVFYKNVKTFILARTLRRNVDLFHDGVLFDVTQPINGNGAKLSGLELSAQTAFTFLPSPFDGFGGVVNYTYSKADDVGLFNALNGEALGFPGLSKHSYNLITYYDKGPLNVRLAYNYRTEYLQSAAERSGNPVIRDGSGYLDAKATYSLKDLGLSFFLEAKNLTGETERSTSGDIRLGEHSYSGKRYFFGASYRF